ncbi:hypothetical protein, partial [Bacteroides acidifaciens]|uniref:hypothetical protein n=2 Tax=Bacteroidaceae TaxID=815 RepID=UPI00272B9191
MEILIVECALDCLFQYSCYHLYPLQICTKQLIFYPSPTPNPGMMLAFVMTKRKIISQNIPVTGFYPTQQTTFLISLSSKNWSRTTVIAQTGKQQLSQLHYYPNQRGIYPV